MAKESIDVAGVRFTADEVEAVRILRGGFSVEIEKIPPEEKTAFGFRSRIDPSEEDDEEEGFEEEI